MNTVSLTIAESSSILHPPHALTLTLFTLTHTILPPQHYCLRRVSYDPLSAILLFLSVFWLRLPLFISLCFPVTITGGGMCTCAHRYLFALRCTWLQLLLISSNFFLETVVQRTIAGEEHLHKATSVEFVE
uniref:Transmembrane protein n=1 Tax=Trypanosoma vivax (strain Y486) TaxID=1055687 RepID=G0TXJ1_TRYVY|nr:hypothetical protein TVY486_0700250 [Trypanosoma vivax Y486]